MAEGRVLVLVELGELCDERVVLQVDHFDASEGTGERWGGRFRRRRWGTNGAPSEVSQSRWMRLDTRDRGFDTRRAIPSGVVFANG